MLTSNKSSAKPPTQPCKMGLINRFLAVSELLILHADSHLYRWTLCTREASRPRAACHLHLLHETAKLCLTHAQPVPRRAAAEQWGDAPPLTFHRAPLSHLMNLYCAHWLPGCHQNAASPPVTAPRIWFGMCNRLWSGARRMSDRCQPGLRMRRDKCQPYVEGAVLNTLRWDGQSFLVLSSCLHPDTP